MCLFPRRMKNRKYIPNKKNGGVVPPLPIWKGKEDKRVMSIAVGCGRCMECMKQKANDWKARLQEEIRKDKRGVFVTMSFSEESLTDLEAGIGLDGQIGEEIGKVEGYDKDNAIASLAMERFVMRWKKKNGKRPKRWLVTELGQKGTERIHIHGVIFCDRHEDVRELWKYGMVFLGNVVNETTINYIVKYLSKTDGKHPDYKPIMRVSPRMGAGYLDRFDKKNNEYKEGDTNESYRLRDGTKIGLPIYYRNKIYTDEERESLWLEKLDENVRWVDGVKIDVSKGYDVYFAALKEAQKKNKRLGYGDKREEWEKSDYERGIRDSYFDK